MNTHDMKAKRGLLGAEGEEENVGKEGEGEATKTKNTFENAVMKSNTVCVILTSPATLSPGQVSNSAISQVPSGS